MDRNGNMWVGIWEVGIVKYDGTSWEVYNDSNSGLPCNVIDCIETDNFGNKWIVSDSGLTVFNEDGIVLVKDKTDESNRIPTNYILHQYYPNPFSPSTTIKYSIPKPSNVTLKVFDVLGSEVVTLYNKEQPQGSYEIELDGSELTSGIYFYRLQAGEYVETKKIVLIK